MLEANTGMTDSSASAPAPSAADLSTPANTQPEGNPGNSGSESADLSADPNAQPAAPVWTPDWKYKVKDKDYEIEDWARGVAKDDDSLKKLKRLFERSTGLDEVVMTRDQLKAQQAAAEPKLKEYETIAKSLNEISHHYNNGDLDSFFERLKIPFDVLFNYVKQKHNQSQLPPEVQQQLESARQARANAYNQSQELEQLKASQQQAETAQKLQYLDGVIAAQAGTVATKFIEANGGNPVAFRDYVIMKGQMMARMQPGSSPSAEDVVNAAVKELSALMGNPVAAQPAAGAPQPQAPGQGAPPVIPAVKSGSQSPVRQPIKSLAEMKKRAQEID